MEEQYESMSDANLRVIRTALKSYASSLDGKKMISVHRHLIEALLLSHACYLQYSIGNALYQVSGEIEDFVIEEYRQISSLGQEDFPFIGKTYSARSYEKIVVIMKNMHVNISSVIIRTDSLARDSRYVHA